MDDDRLLEQWAEDFKRAGHQIPEISRSVRKSAVYQYVELVINIAAWLIVIGIIAHHTKPLSPDIFFLKAFGVLVGVIAMTFYFRYRRGTWRAAEETPRGLLEFLRKQEQARLREARASEIIAFLAVMVLVIFSIRRTWISWEEQPELLAKQVVNLILVFAVWCGCFFLLRYWTRRKKRNLDKVALLEKSFDNGIES